jgi:curved DNA-binding protein CbpA
MSVVQPYLEARALLGVSLEASLSDIKKAYRRLVIEHPPDTDPEGFRRIRDAYELLTDTGERARAILLRPIPAIAPPSPPDFDSHAARGSTAIALLRAIAARINLNVLLGDTVVPGERRS